MSAIPAIAKARNGAVSLGSGSVRISTVTGSKREERALTRPLALRGLSSTVVHEDRSFMPSATRSAQLATFILDDAYRGYMPHTDAKPSRAGSRTSAGKRRSRSDPRYTVARYASTVDTSMGKAIASLVRLGLEGQESRKAEFFKKLKANLANDDPNQQDQLVDEFRTLILGR